MHFDVQCFVSTGVIIKLCCFIDYKLHILVINLDIDFVGMFCCIDFYLKLKVCIRRNDHFSVKQDLYTEICPGKYVDADSFRIISVCKSVDRVCRRCKFGEIDPSVKRIRIESGAARVHDYAGICFQGNNITFGIQDKNLETCRHRPGFDTVAVSVREEFVCFLRRVCRAGDLRVDDHRHFARDVAERIDIVRSEQIFERLVSCRKCSGCQDHRFFFDRPFRLEVSTRVFLNFIASLTFDFDKNFLDIRLIYYIEINIIREGADFRDVRSRRHVASVEDLDRVSRCVERVDDRYCVHIAVYSVKYHVCSFKKAFVEIFNILTVLEYCSGIAQDKEERPEEIEFLSIWKSAVEGHEELCEDSVGFIHCDFRSVKRNVTRVIKRVDFIARSRRHVRIEPCADKLIGGEFRRNSTEIRPFRRCRDVVSEYHQLFLACNIFVVYFRKTGNRLLCISRIICRSWSWISHRDHRWIKRIRRRRASVVWSRGSIECRNSGPEFEAVSHSCNRSLSGNRFLGFEPVVELRNIEDVFDQIEVPVIA